MCHLYLLYSARSLGLSNQFHKDTGLISAAVHIMRRALLLSSAELLVRGHEQINRDVTQLPHSPAPQWTQRWEGDVMRGAQRTKHPARKGCDPCKVHLVMPNLQNFIISASVCLIIRKLPSHLSQHMCVCLRVVVGWGWGVRGLRTSSFWLSPSTLCRPL